MDSGRREDTTLVQAIASLESDARAGRDRCTLTMVAGPLPGSVLVVDGAELVLGRAPAGRGVRIDDVGLSRQHARIVRIGDKYFVEDLNSTNGTFLNGEKVPASEARPLTDGDRLHVGKNTMFRVSFLDELEQAAAQRMYEAAVRDPLTQIHNRRYLDERLESEFAFAQRHRTPLSVLLLDVDHFKTVNDTHGHMAGDAVLRVVAGALQRMVRVEDLVARYGGEEFCVVARGIDAPNAMLFAERIRKTIVGLRIPWEATTIQISASLGVATMTAGHPYDSLKQLVAASDHALYRAKQSGRNRASAAP